MEAGEGPLVVLAHGFPELSYSWRHQVPALAEAGYRVLAPDQRGYGRSRAGARRGLRHPHLTGDLIGLLDDLGEEQAVFVGHDWGSMVVWQTALLHPERVAGVVGMSVPFLPRAPMPPIELMRQVLGDNFFYILYFQEPGVADAELGADAATDDAPDAGRRHPPRRGSGRPLVHGARRPGLRRPDARARAAARLAHPGRARPLHRRVHPHRLHRRHQLVPQLRPQLGADRAARRCPCHGAVAVHRRGARPGPGHEPARRRRPVARPTTAATWWSTAPATGCSRSRPPRSTPPSSSSLEPRSRPRARLGLDLDTHPTRRS